MCGIAGLVDPAAQSSHDELSGLVEGMNSLLVHRGPDGAGLWIDEQVGVAFGHRRLSVIDLSEAGAQPMVSNEGRYVMAFNGEIYNHRQLRAELRDVPFRGTSDTEVLLAAIERSGFPEVLTRVSGMFAIAVWDRKRRELILARDRFGEKPLYYGFAGRQFAFASELPPLRFLPGMSKEIDPEGRLLYFRYGYVPAPCSILASVRKLPPASWLRWRPREGPQPTVDRYWSLPPTVSTSAASTDDRTVREEFEERLRASVRNRMVSDVPIGAYLSSGTDSSSIVAMMQQESNRPIKTFTVGFVERSHDEAPSAKAIAKYLGCDHHELYVTESDLLKTVPQMPRIYGEPFADSSQVPTVLLSAFARSEVTVALSGDGGDELFGGYSRYARVERRWQLRSRFPERVVRPARTVCTAFSRHMPLSGATGGVRSSANISGLLGWGVSSAERFLGAASLPDLYDEAVAIWAHPELLLNGEPRRWWGGRPDGSGSPRQQMARLDASRYLPDDIMVKVDRASMDRSLEVRVPLLDHELFEYVWALPRRFTDFAPSPKWLLRSTLLKHVPHELADRPKSGFSAPMDRWLRGPLREWAEQELVELEERDAGLNMTLVRRLWDEQCRGERDWAGHLWPVLMFSAWHRSGPVKRPF